MDRLKLLPCPFCGYEAELRKQYSALEGEPKHYVRCSSGKCGARYVPGGFPVDEWNSRQSLSHEAVRLRDADILAAAVDYFIQRGLLDSRSLIADCRLDYGQPFTPEQTASHLERRRHGKNSALKREPNAAGRAEAATRMGHDGPEVANAPSHEGHAAGPAPAAPDVAEMVRRLRAVTANSQLCREAAVLLANLWQQIETLRAAHDLGLAHKECPNCGADMMTAANPPPPERIQESPLKYPDQPPTTQGQR